MASGDLYNPGSEIIRAFMEGVKSKREKEQSILEKQKLDQQMKEHQNTLDEHVREFDLTQSLQKALHEVQMHEHQMNMLKLSAPTGLPIPGSTETQSVDPSQDPVQMLNQGLDKQGIAPRVYRNIDFGGGQPTLQIPNPFDYNKQQAETESQLLKPKTDAAIAQAKGTFEATLPGKIQLETLKTQNQQLLEDKKSQVQQTIAQMNNNGRKYAADVSASARRYAADHQKSGVDADEIANTATLVASGKMSLPTGANGIHVASVLQGQGMVPLDKATEDKVKALGSLPLMFQDLENFANKNLSDTKGFGPFTTYLQSKIPQSEIANDAAALKVNAGPVARIFEGQTGRLTMQQISLALEAMTSGSITKQEALKRVAELKKKANSKLYNEVLAGVPPKQQEMIVSGMGLPYSFAGKQLTVHYSDGSTEQIEDTPSNRLKVGMK